MPYFLLTVAVTFNGAHVEAGEVIELTEKSGQALVEEDKAVEVEPDGETLKALQEPAGEGGQEPDPAEADAKTVKALDDQYKRDELATAAKEAGVEFAYDAKKGEIIAAVMEQGKAEALLK